LRRGPPITGSSSKGSDGAAPVSIARRRIRCRTSIVAFTVVAAMPSGRRRK
jgi:hypothetical protein